jgi:N-acetylglucosamine-6-phosphate deacetylase
MLSIHGQLVTPAGVRNGYVMMENGRIADITLTAKPGAFVQNQNCDWIVPGFIDLHMHGIEHHSILDVKGITGAAESEARYGTTGFLPTGYSRTVSDAVAFLEAVRQVQENGQGKGAEVLGAHLEGPFINPQNKGGMDVACLRPMNVDECKVYIHHAQGALKLMTLSPELPGSEEVIRYLSEQGVVVSLGHSRCRPEDLPAAVKAGLRHVCHLFNTFDRAGEAEPGVWAAGLVETILTHPALSCELICDMHHVLPEYIKITARLLGPDRFVAITDNLTGAGFTEGEYPLPDGRTFKIEDGVGRIPGLGLVGSMQTLNKSFGKLITVCGIDPVTASRFTSTNAAGVLGIDNEVGSLEIGKRANIAVLNSNFDCVATFIDGVKVYGN